MNGQYAMWEQPMLEFMNSVIFSQELRAGVMPCASPDGLKINQSGQAHALASPSPSQEKAKEQRTSGTCGPSSSGLSESVDLQQFSENKWLQKLLLDGSMEYSLTLKERVTPAGRRIFALRGSGRRTLDNGYTGWPTPQEDNANNAAGHKGTSYSDLPSTEQLTGWPTASSRDWKDTPGMSETGTNPDGSERKRLDQLPRVAALAGWITPDCSDRRSDKSKQQGLTNMVKELAGWKTPHASDGEGGVMEWREGAEGHYKLRDMATWMDTGITSESSNAGTGKQEEFLLNPRFSLWLQGFPDAWACSGVRAMQSSRKSQRRSLKHTCKRGG